MLSRLCLAAGVALAAAALAAGPSSEVGGERVGALRPDGAWSLGSYPGWVQQYRLPPRDVDYSPFTHILHFAMYPARDGRLRMGDIIRPANARSAVASAHAHRRPIVLVVGGEGEGAEFRAATRGRRRHRLVREIVAALDRYGYDGVSVDWEEHVVGPRFVAFVTELHAALAPRDPRPLLMLDVLDSLVRPRIAARVARLVDSVNVFSYYRDPGSRIERQFNLYRAAGVPAGKIVAGIGIFPRGYDRSPRRVARKLAFVASHGLRGVELWSLQWVRKDDARIRLIGDFIAAESRDFSRSP